MAETPSTSMTLPQNRPDDENVPTVDSFKTSSDESKEPKSLASTNSSNEVSSGDDKPVGVNDESDTKERAGTESPPRDNVTVLTKKTRKYKFESSEEQRIQSLINRASQATKGKDNVTMTEGDIATLTRTVSQLITVMAANRVGKETTIRALAYLNGEDEPTPNQALQQAKADRRQKSAVKYKARQASREMSMQSNNEDATAAGSLNNSEHNLPTSDDSHGTTASIAEATTVAVGKAKEVIIGARKKDENADGKTFDTAAKTNGGLLSKDNKPTNGVTGESGEKTTNDDARLANKFKKAKGNLRHRWSWKNKRNGRKEGRTDQDENDPSTTAADKATPDDTSQPQAAGSINAEIIDDKLPAVVATAPVA